MKKYIALLISFAIIEIGLALYLTVWREHFWNAVSNKEQLHFLQQLGIFTVVALVCCFVSGISGYLVSLTAIKWREKLNDTAFKLYGEELYMQNCTPIAGFPGYFINRSGDVYSNYRYKFAQLKPAINKAGYQQLQLTKNKKQYNKLIHRLVAETFLIQESETYIQVNHKNGDKADNHMDNLEWCTSSINNKHAYDLGLNTCKGLKNSQVKLTEIEVREIRSLYPTLSIKDLSVKYRVTYSNIFAIVHGKSWKHLL